MQNPYSEEQLIEQSAITLLENMGWHHQNCIDEFQYSDEKLTGRKTKSQVVLTDRLRAALERLNPDVPSDAIDTAIETLTQSLRSELNSGVARDREKPLKTLIQYMEQTDMAVVVSKSQNEIDDTIPTMEKESVYIPKLQIYRY